MIIRLLALVMAASMLSNLVAAPRTVLGVVAEAKRGHLNSAAATTGTTVYDGDRFSTETGGWLRVQSGAVTLELAGESVASVQNPPNGAQGLEVELVKGALVFGTARAGSLNVIALKARVRAAADIRTFARITVTGPKELRIDPRHGSLLFSYKGETETIAEGKSYRVILDPPGDSPKERGPLPPAKWPKPFKIVVLGEVEAVIGLGIYELLEPESPDRP